MANDFTLSVVAPDHSVVEEQVVSVVAPGAEGYFGVMAGHVPLIASLKPGILEYLDAHNQRHYIYAGGGFAEVTATRVTILADEAAKAKDIDVAEAERRLDDARNVLRGGLGSVDTEHAVLELDRAIARLRAARLSDR
ncbi:MAG TPA: ATP synthase F1 subunit epsilon [Fimbriimonadaceae bacterium]|nr:ATP synthase F1 subunit epsilon [Fimbriimonadaceae bacterium]